MGKLLGVLLILAAFLIIVGASTVATADMLAGLVMAAVGAILGALGTALLAGFEPTPRGT